MRDKVVVFVVGVLIGCSVAYLYKPVDKANNDHEQFYLKEYINANNKALIASERARVAEKIADSLRGEVERLKKNRMAIVKKQQKEYEKIDTLSSVSSRLRYLDSIWAKRAR